MENLNNPGKYIKKINVARVTSDNMKILDAEFSDKKDYQEPLDEVSEELQNNFDSNREKERVNYLEEKRTNISNREYDRRRNRNDDKTKKFEYSRN